jgi:hypothetical protein
MKRSFVTPHFREMTTRRTKKKTILLYTYIIYSARQHYLAKYDRADHTPIDIIIYKTRTCGGGFENEI